MAGGEVLGVNLLMEDVLQSGSLGTVQLPDLKSQVQSQSMSRGDATEPADGPSHNVISDLKQARNALGKFCHAAVAFHRRALTVESV